jgi:hemolysin III
MMDNLSKDRIESDNEKKYNFLTHFFGLLMSLIGMILLVNKSIDSQMENKLFCAVVYGASLTFMYMSSSLYHYFIDNKYSNSLQKLDHVSIYLLIAGSYTPPILLNINSFIGDIILIIIWSMAIIGVIHKVFFFNYFKNLSLIFYLIMGWLIVIDFKTVLVSFTNHEIILMVIGGILYSVGAVFYSMDQLKYNHVIWHIFVLLGSISHFFLMNSII